MQSSKSRIILNKTRANNLLQKIFIKNFKYIFLQETKYYKFMRKKNEGKHIVKKDHWGNITTRYTEYKHKNTGTTCTSVHISRLQCFNPSTKFWKTVSLRPSFGLSVKIWSQFSRLVCFNWVRNEVFTSLILGKNLWTWQTRRTDAWK